MRRLVFAAVAIVAIAHLGYAQSAYVRSIEDWRAGHAAELTADDGWFTLAGLFWLNEGINRVGRGNEFDVRLTDSFAGGRFGEIELRADVATLRVEPNVYAEADGKSVREVRLMPEVDGKATRITVGSQMFYMIKREDKYAIRLKDKNNKALREFKGLRWYPVNRRYRMTATLIPFDKPREIEIPNVLGGTFRLMSPGVLRFRLGGKTLTLQPVLEGEKLFIVFRDTTSRTATYGAGRFLYAERGDGGKVVLDFNKAENPPCAYTEFATCPLPPQQNRLRVAIPAGEKRYK